MEALIDTHCHIHDSEYDFLIEDVLKQASLEQIKAMICVGTDERSSHEALAFAQAESTCRASLGLHPHLATQSLEQLKTALKTLSTLAHSNSNQKCLVAIGECGLDYFYHKEEAIRERQRQLCAWQMDLARELKLPLIFHVRQAWSDFWPLYDRYRLPGVLHSFSDITKEVEKALSYPQLYLGLNGIMTFSKDEQQLAAAKAIPASRLLLETDAPYLTPAPHRGKINKPEYLRIILDFLAALRGEQAADLARSTTQNAVTLFKLGL